MRPVILALALVAAILLTSSLSFAAPDPQRIQQYQDNVAQLAEQLGQQRAALEDGQWTPAELEEYLWTALFLVYSGKIYANYGFGPDAAPTTADLTQLVALGYLPLWPDNPLSGWQPMQVLTPEDGFAPGELCFALCPPSYASTFGVGTQQLSFDMFVYAPEAGSGRQAEIETHTWNVDWRNIPPDTLFGLAYGVVPDFKLVDYRKELERRRAAREGEQPQ